VFGRRIVTVTVTPDVAMPAMVTIVRGCLIRRLRLSRVRRGLCGGLRSGGLLDGEKKCRHRRQQQNIQDTFHCSSPKRMKIPCSPIESQDAKKVAGEYGGESRAS